MIDRDNMNHLTYSISFYLSNKNVKSINKRDINKNRTYPRHIYDQYFTYSIKNI
jgi:hypothetical protein